MRVLAMVSDTVWGGKHRYMTDILTQFAERGHDVCCAATQSSAMVERAAAEGIAMIGVPDYRECPAEAAVALAETRQLADADIVMVTGRHDGAVAAQIDNARAVRVAFRHSAFPLQEGSPAHAVYAAADLVVATSVEQAYRQFPDRRSGQDLIVLESGVSDDYLARLAALDADLERANLGIGPERPVISVIGRLSWEKGVDRIINAFTEVVRHVPQAVLLVVGGGADEPSLRRQAAELGIADSVIFTGYQVDVVKYVGVSTVGVLGSTVPETGPYALKELMAAGVPVVAPEVGGIPDFVRDGVNGWLYRSDDELRTCLLRAVDEGTRLSTVSSGARRTILDEHRLEPRVDALENAIVRTAIRKLDARSWLPELELDEFRIRPEREGGFVFVPHTSQLAQIGAADYEMLKDLRSRGIDTVRQWPGPQASAIAELLFDMGALATRADRVGA